MEATIVYWDDTGIMEKKVEVAKGHWDQMGSDGFFSNS